MSKRLISEEDVIRRIQEDIDKRIDKDDFIHKAVVAGLEMAKIEVLLSETKGWTE